MKAEEEQRLFWNVAMDAERAVQAADARVIGLEAQHQALLKELREARHAVHLAILERAQLGAVLKDSGFTEDQVYEVRLQVQGEVRAQIRAEVSGTLVLA